MKGKLCRENEALTDGLDLWSTPRSFDIGALVEEALSSY